MSLSRFAVWNLLGQGLPLAVALISYPLLLHFAGFERVGAMSLAWALVGYLGLLDFGLGRVVTRRIALAHAHGTLANESLIVGAMLVALALVAILFTALLWVSAERWLHQVGLSPAILNEARAALPWLMFAILPTALGAFMSGILEGLESFGRVNAARVGSALWGYLGPVVVAFIDPSLVAMIAVVAIGRWLALIAIALGVHSQLPRAASRSAKGLQGEMLTALREGGWIAVSNVVGPLMTVFDRFVLAFIAGAAVVPFYTISYDFISKALVIPAALLASIFPTLARGSASNESRVASDAMALRTSGWIAATLGPICIGVGAAGYALLSGWLGTTFALHAHETLRWLALGMLLNGLAHLPFGILQANRRARTTALIHLAELPVYFALLWMWATEYGPLGAAMAWSARAGLDLAALLFFSRSFRTSASNAMRWIGLAVLLCAMASAFGTLLAPAVALDIGAFGVFVALSLYVSDRILRATNGVGAFDAARAIHRRLMPSQTSESR